MSIFSLKGRKALVTGSTKGIGAAIASAIKDAGADMLWHGRTAPPDVPEDRVLKVDLSKEDGASQLIEQSLVKEPDLDLLVCNAGSFFDSDFLEMDIERFRKTIHLNVEQVYFLIQAFSRNLVQKKRPGTVVIISSTNGFMAEEGSTAYDTSKGALVMMTRSLALTLAPHGIRVNGVGPGLIRTPLTSWMDQKPDVVKHYENKTLVNRIGVPEDCAGICVFLSSDAASYIVGQTIIVDGGLTVGQIGKM